MHQAIRSNSALLYSERARRGRIVEATETEQIYRFTGADGKPRTWLKGQHAYLAPNALSNVLLRWEIKHDVIGDEDILTDLDAYSVLFLPGADRLDDAQIDAIVDWLEGPDRFLVATDGANLPPSLLGISSTRPCVPSGYTAWNWTHGSPFADVRAWGPPTISGARGYRAAATVAGPGATVLAKLVEVDGDVSSSTTATLTELGDALISTPKTLFIANQPFEFLGGVLQAHLNVEDVRMWDAPTHWGDVLAYKMREALRRSIGERLWGSTLCPFSSYDGVLQIRHDVDHPDDQALDFSMLEAELDAGAPASYYVMDADYCKTRCTVMGGKMWSEALARSNLFEVGQHNDSVEGDPPRNIVGTGLTDHIAASDLTMGTRSRTAGRHMGFLVYPETIDAMADLYDRNPDVLGLCTFSLYDVLEYGVRDPRVVIQGKPLTYSTYDHARPERPAAISGYWFPYHAVLSTVEEHRTLRGWDVTHDTDCDFDRIETLLDGKVGANSSPQGRLENGVFTIQYENQLAQAPFENETRGHLPWLRYALAYAERENFWITTKVRLYERMNDYQDVVMRRDGEREWTIHNPTDRRIEGLCLRTGIPDATLLCGDRTMVHALKHGLVLLPMLKPGEIVSLSAVDVSKGPRVRQPNSRFLEIAEAWISAGTKRLFMRGQVIRNGHVVIECLTSDQVFIVMTKDNRGSLKTKITLTADGRMAIPVFGQRDNLVPFAIELLVNEPSQAGRGGSCDD